VSGRSETPSIGLVSDIRTQQISLVGQVVEDVSFAPLRSREFVAELIGLKRSPLYKEGGFFVFTNLRPGHYTLRIAAERFQPQEYLVSIPLHQFAALSFIAPGGFLQLLADENPGANHLDLVRVVMAVEFDEDGRITAA
jgi:hypothetical protein